MTPAAWAVSAGFGVAGGFLAGLIGVGGGVVLVPFLYLLLEHPGWSGATVPADRITLVAHASSLAVIVPTSLSALHAHARNRLVPWRIVGLMGVGAAVAALLTTRVAPRVPDEALRVAFALFLVAVGIRLARGRERPSSTEIDRPPPRLALGLAGGLAVGAFSALLGVGGGLLAIPVLIWGFGVDLRRVAAGSIGVVACAALAGAVGYLGATPDVDPGAGTVGWVFLPATLALVPGAVLGARWGADLNRRLETRTLRRVFAIVLVVLGVRLGIDAWADRRPESPSPRPVSGATLR